MAFKKDELEDEICNSLEIRLGEEWRITSDRYNYILQKLKGKERKRWSSEGHYSNIQALLNSYRSILVKDCGAKSIKEAYESVVKLNKELEKTITKDLTVELDRIREALEKIKRGEK